MNAQVPTRAEPKSLSYASVPMDQAGAGGMLAPKSLGEVVAFAQVMARADLALPKHLRGNDGACMAVAMQAMRWEMDPFAVANKSYSVNDRLAFEAQLVAAVVHTRAPIRGRPNYVYSGEGATRRCQVICTMADGEQREYTSPTFAQITTKNSPLWKSDPDQQLGYFAIRSWARRHAPEVILGVYTPDEVSEIRETLRPAAPAGLAARLAASVPAAEGFTAAQAEAEPPHDAETGEIVDAEIEEIEAAEDFPGDAPRQTAQEPATAPQAVAPASQVLGTLSARVGAFRASVSKAPTSAEMNAIRKRAGQLFRDIEAGDPDEVGTPHELAAWFDSQVEAMDAKEREGGA